jgi:uncharacterized membrane protein
VRAGIAVFGVVLVLVGAVLWYFPLVSESSSIEVPNGDAYVFGLPGTLIIGPVPYAASWTANAPANVTVYSCGTDSGCPNGPNSPAIGAATGSSGSIHWTSSAGHYFLLVPNTTSNVTVTYEEPVGAGLAGLGVLGIGVIVVVVGLALRRPASDATDPMPPTSP